MRLPVLACALWLGLGPAFAVAEEPTVAEELTPAKMADIRALLEATEAVAVKQLRGLFVGQMTQMLKQVRADIPPRALELVAEEVSILFDEEFDGEYTKLLLPIYNRHYTHDEIRRLLAFYTSPLGRKVSRVGPEIARESIPAGQKIAQSLGPKVQERCMIRLRKEGFANQ